MVIIYILSSANVLSHIFSHKYFIHHLYMYVYLQLVTGIRLQPYIRTNVTGFGYSAKKSVTFNRLRITRSIVAYTWFARHNTWTTVAVQYSRVRTEIRPKVVVEVRQCRFCRVWSPYTIKTPFFNAITSNQSSTILFCTNSIFLRYEIL